MTPLLKIICSRKMLIMILFGFSSGMPLALTGGTLQAWMKDLGVNLSLIGVFAIVGLPYSLKFLWAPFLDRFSLPLLTRRRGWIVFFQALIAVFTAVLAFQDPFQSAFATALVAVLIAFSSASQDIVIDAYRAENLETEEMGLGTSLFILGYRLAMLTSGALSLILADHLSWNQVYLTMALISGLGILATFFANEAQAPSRLPKSLKETVWDPLADYFKRRGAVEMLLFILLFKLGDTFASALSTAFFLDLQFTKTAIGAVNKGGGLLATIVGTFVGGAILYRWKLYKSLWIFGILQAVSNLMFFLLARAGHHEGLMVATIVIENFCGGMGTAAFTAFMMSLCNRKFTATQYALLSSLMATGRTFLSTPSGFMATSLGWPAYYLMSTLIAIPGLLMLLRFKRWTTQST